MPRRRRSWSRRARMRSWPGRPCSEAAPIRIILRPSGPPRSVPAPPRRDVASLRAQLKTTRYFEEQVLRKRPYLQRSWCSEVLEAPLRREVQSDGRMTREAREIVEGIVVAFDAKL